MAHSEYPYNWAETGSCPREAFNELIKSEYLTDKTKKKTTSAKYHTREQLLDRINRYERKKTFIEERDKKLAIAKKTKFRTNPEEIRILQRASQEAGDIDLSKFKVTYDEEGNPTLWQIGGKPYNNEFVTVEPLEDAYDLLWNLHATNQHSSGNDLYTMVCEERLFSFPREIIRAIPQFCQVCWDGLIEKKESSYKKKGKKKTTQHRKHESIATDVVTSKIIHQQALRRSDIATIQVRTGDVFDISGFILTYICHTSCVMLSRILSELQGISVYHAIIDIFTSTAVPKVCNIHFDVKEKEEELYSEVRDFD